jgi:CRP/FNR family cyclic AMP-dependent transcriptional regulator
VTSNRGPRSVEATPWGTLPGPGFVEPVEEAALGKDAFEPLTGAVPGAIATGGIGESEPSGRPRPDRPLGKRGADLLAQVPLFEGLSRRHLKQIAEHADEISFREREIIVEADQPGGTFFVIVEGEVRVVRGDRTIARAGPGEFFGEISLLDGGPRTASVIAETPVVAIRLFKGAFDKVVREEPRVAGKILAVVARRLREAEKTVTA